MKDKIELGNDFPKTPVEIRKRIENEVAKQLKSNSAKKTVPFFLKYKAAVIAAAILVFGTTVYAGSRIFQLYMEKNGDYGLKTGINMDASSNGGNPAKIRSAELQINYIPEGMIKPDGYPGKMFYEETPFNGGISMSQEPVSDTVSVESYVSDTHILSSEKMEIAGRDAIYMEFDKTGEIKVAFDKKMYVLYPEVQRMLTIYIGSDVSKEEAIKVAENTEINLTGDYIEEDNMVFWGDNSETGKGTDNPVEESKRTATAEEMENTHEIGESFSVFSSADTESESFIGTDKVYAKVTDIKITDDLSPLGNMENVDENLKSQINAEGKLTKNTIAYIKSGDGVNSLDQVIKTEDVSQKLVYATIEFTNTDEVALKNILFHVNFVGMTEKDGLFQIYNRAESETEAQWDKVNSSSSAGFGEMQFYDVKSGSENKNYISELAPGKTVIVHVARLLNEDELKYLYLNLGEDGIFALSEQALADGYVDVAK